MTLRMPDDRLVLPSARQRPQNGEYCGARDQNCRRALPADQSIVRGRYRLGAGKSAGQPTLRTPQKEASYIDVPRAAFSSGANVAYFSHIDVADDDGLLQSGIAH